jgi:hypothetical protein
MAMNQLTDIFADLHGLDILTLDRVIREIQRIRDERRNEADEEANRSNGSSGAPDASPNGRK